MTFTKLLYKVSRRLYRYTRRDFGVDQLIPISIMPDLAARRGRRLNLVLPEISERYAFGGTATARRLFKALIGSFDSGRIIVLNEKPTKFARWRRLDSSTGAGNFETTYLGGRNPALSITSQDFFIATMWTTAILVQQILARQALEFDNPPERFVYLIQDFEPGFYPWSDRYAYADSTYRSPKQALAVFNTQLLADYFHSAGFRFTDEFTFEPAFNQQLRKLRDATDVPKQRIILVYGRPSVPRNCFDVLVDGLRLWANAYQQSACWTLISVGERHASVPLGNGLTLRAVGKLSLSEYALYLAQASVGISLMESPHPSYPPLEMAEFGCRVITNKYANKDLSCRASNILSLESMTAARICEALTTCCNSYTPGQAVATGAPSVFLGGPEEFPFIPELITAWRPNGKNEHAE